MEKKKKFPVWKTVTIGGKSKKQLRAGLKRNGCYVNHYGAYIMRKITVSEKTMEIPLVKIKVRDVIAGENKQITTEEFFSEAKKLGLGLCPAEVGPYFSLMVSKDDKELYKNINDYCFSVAMEPVSGPDSVSSWIFYIGHNDLESFHLGAEVFELKRPRFDPWGSDVFVFVDEQS